MAKGPSGPRHAARAQMGVAQQRGRRRVGQRRRVDEAAVLGGANSGACFARRQAGVGHGRGVGGRSQVLHPAIAADILSALAAGGHQRQALGRERRDPRVEPMRRQIERALHQVLQALRVQRRADASALARNSPSEATAGAVKVLSPSRNCADRAGSGDRRDGGVELALPVRGQRRGLDREVGDRKVGHVDQLQVAQQGGDIAGGVARPRRCSRSCSIAAMSAGGAVAVIRAAALANSRSMAWRSSASSKLDLARPRDQGVDGRCGQQLADVVGRGALAA